MKHHPSPIKTLALGCIASLAPQFAQAAVIDFQDSVVVDSTLVDIDTRSNIFRDYRGASSTRQPGDQLVFSVKVSDTAASEPDQPRPDTFVFAEQVENGGDPDATTGFSRSLFEFFGPGIPNEYVRSVDWQDGFAESAWKIVALPDFSTTMESPNPNREVVLTTDSTLSTNNHLPLSTNVTMDGERVLSWTVPATDVFYNNYRVTVIRESDRKIISLGGRTPIDWDGGSAKSLSVDIDTLQLAEGESLEQGQGYELRIETVHSDPSRTFSQQISRSSTFANFTPLPPGTGPVVLPTRDMQGNFNFDVEVFDGQAITIDPFVAIGYDYVIGTNDPNFQSVMIPMDLTANGFYELIVNGNSEQLAANTWYDFGTGGVTAFRIQGIDPAFMLDPNDTTAFMTTLTFAGSGQFTGSMSPIKTFVPDQATVPAPAPLLLIGLGAMIARRCKAS